MEAVNPLVPEPVWNPKLVPNRFPVAGNSRVALIGGFPSEKDSEEGKPFQGWGGTMLDGLLAKAQIMRVSSFAGHIFQATPKGKFLEDNVSPSHPLRIEGLNKLAADLAIYQPHICVLFGEDAYRAFTTNKPSLHSYRGSLFMSDVSPLAGYKCLATYHPDRALAMYEWVRIILFDLCRAKQEADSPVLNLPQRDIQLDPAQFLVNDYSDVKTLGIDIEGGVDGIPCISVAPSPFKSTIIAFNNNGHVHDSLTERAQWRKFNDLMRDVKIGKILQNGIYDRFVLAYAFGILIRNIQDDTLMKGWECFCEFKKSLGFQTSIWTREPYYKEDKNDANQETFFRYCCKDSAVTVEIAEAQDNFLSGDAKLHYLFNVALLNPFLYMQLRGIRYDSEAAKEALTVLHKKQAALQEKIDAEVVEYRGQWKGGKKNPQWKQPMKLNVESIKQLIPFFEEELKIKVPWKYDKKTDEEKQSLDKANLLRLYKTNPKPIIQDILLLRALNAKEEVLRWTVDDDGRMRCSYSPVGTVTGRCNCSSSVTGSGGNLQTVTKKLRYLFLADEGYEIGQLDLAGADGWTVAARCADLGDSTMLDDYLFGLKPAKILALMFEYGLEVNTWSREKIKAESKKISGESSIYFVCKVVQHGSNYGMRGKRMSENVMEKSYKMTGVAMYVEISLCERIQSFYFARYSGVRNWHKAVETNLHKTHKLVCANGHTRQFFGRMNDDKTLREALSDEPQNNTTFICNVALLRLWRDKENRLENGDLRVRCVHQVHDAILPQWRIEDREFAKRKLREWFDIPLRIGSILVKIPFEGTYGPNWGMHYKHCAHHKDDAAPCDCGANERTI